MRFWLVRFFSGPVMRTNRGLAVVPKSDEDSKTLGGNEEKSISYEYMLYFMRFSIYPEVL